LFARGPVCSATRLGNGEFSTSDDDASEEMEIAHAQSVTRSRDVLAELTVSRSFLASHFGI
jgi:hypothetical protein